VSITDDLTVTVRTTIPISASPPISISSSHIECQRTNSREYVSSILFPTTGMSFITSPHDPISMYSAIEPQTPSFHVLAALGRNNEFSTEAGLKYSVPGALPSGPSPFGESIIHGSTGITNSEESTKPFASRSNSTELHVQTVGPNIMSVASPSKISAVPLHTRTPDVHEGAPTSVTASSAITPKIAILSPLSRLRPNTFWDLVGSFGAILIVRPSCPTIIGATGTVNQNRIKRSSAHSPIAHVGHLPPAPATGTIESAESLSPHIIIHMLMVIPLWAYLLAPSGGTEDLKTLTPYIPKGNLGVNGPGAYGAHRVISKNNASSFGGTQRLRGKDDGIKYITDPSRLSRTNPVSAVTTAAILSPNAGLPPPAGFHGKSNTFSAAIEGPTYSLAVAGVPRATSGASHPIRSVKIIHHHPARPR
jgi:NADH-quinone oxidoreductase subunit N